MISPGAFLGFHAGGRRRSAGAAPHPYVGAVLADTPYAFYRLNEPLGSTTINDSSGNGRHVSGVSTSVQLGRRPLCTDPAGGSAWFDGTISGIALGSGLATAILNGAAWSVEVMFYPDETNSWTHAGYPVSGAASSTKRFAVQLYNNGLLISSTVGGNNVTPSNKVHKQPHHLIVTSDGRAYIDGISIGTGSGATLNSTVNMFIGGLNSGAVSGYKGRVAEVSFYQSALTAERCQAHYAAAMAFTPPAGRTFRWTMESDLVDQAPPGAEDYPQYDASTRSTAQAASGTYSLQVSGAFNSATFDNGTQYHRWCGTTEGAFKFQFRYTGAITNSCMLFQITGKDRQTNYDSNDGHALLLTPSGLTVGGNIPLSSIPPDTWHTVVYKFWVDAGTTYSELTLNGSTTISGSGAFVSTVQAWHHLLIGNDRNFNTSGLWIDNFEVHGSRNSPDL